MQSRLWSNVEPISSEHHDKKNTSRNYANGNLVLVKALLNSLYVDDMTPGESRKRWPLHRTKTEAPAECLQEIKSSTSTNLTAIETSAAATIDCNRYSSPHPLLRVTAYVKWFVHNISLKERIIGPLSINKKQEAKILWIREMQGNLQVDEFKKQLELFNDEKGIIGCRGPLGNSEA